MAADSRLSMAKQTQMKKLAYLSENISLSVLKNINGRTFLATELASLFLW
jgi:hypothetical protein